jgi:hypothetical protein
MSFGQNRAPSFRYSLEVAGFVVGTFTNVGPIAGIDRNFAEATDATGQIHEVPMRWKIKRFSLACPVEGGVTEQFLAWAKTGALIPGGSVIVRDASDNIIAVHVFRGAYIASTGADGGDKESDAFIMQNSELVVDEWLS